MANCNFSNFAAMGEQDKYETILKQVANHFTKDEAKVESFAKKLLDFHQVINTSEGKLALQAMGDGENMITKTDEWVEKHTFGAYKSFDEFTRSGDTNAAELLNAKLNEEIKYVAAVYKDPNMIKKDTALSKEFRNFFNFHAGVFERGNMATLLLNGDAIGIHGDVFLNRSNMFKQNRAIQRVNASIEGIQNSTANYLDKARKHIKNLIKDHTDKIVTDKILTKYIGFLDGGYTDGKAIIRKQLEEVERMDSDQITHTMTVLDAFQKQWNMFNYGVEDPANFGGEGVRMTNADAMSDQFSNSIRFNKENIPTFLHFVLTTGNRINSLVSDRTSELHPMERKVAEMFGPDGTFKIRTSNYVPSQKDDIFKDIIDSPVMSRLYGDVNFLQERKTMMDNHDTEPVNFLEVFTNNVKSFKHFVAKMSEYSGYRVIKDKLDNNPAFAQSNPQAYRSINHLAEVIIKDYEGEPKKVSSGVQMFKKMFGAMNGLVASTILMNSAPANYAAGGLTIASRLGIKKPFELVSSYTSAIKKAGDEGDIAREVKDYFANYSPYSKVSDMITRDTSMKDISVNKVMDTLANAATQFSDFAVSRGILGLLPGMKWLSFNESENKLLKISEALAYNNTEKAVELGRLAAEREGVEFDQKKFIREYLSDNNETIFTMTKEAVGDFSRYAKPIWSWKTFRDADTISKVMRGGMLSMWYMFKQVEFVNMHVLNRLAGAIASPLKNEFAAPASAGMAIGVVFLTMYDWLTRKEEELPRVGLALGATPTGSIINTYQGLKGLIKLMGNMPVTEQEANDIASFWRIAGGVPFGAAMRQKGGFPEGNLKSVIDNFSFNMDFGYGFFKALSDGAFEKHSASQVYKFDKSMKEALAKNTLLFGLSNDALRLIEDTAVISNAIYSAIGSTNKKAASRLLNTAKNRTFSTLQRMLGLGVYFGPKHYKNLAYRDFDYENESFRTAYWKQRSTHPRKDDIAFAVETYDTIPKNWIYKSSTRTWEYEQKKLQQIKDNPRYKGIVRRDINPEELRRHTAVANDRSTEAIKEQNRNLTENIKEMEKTILRGETAAENILHIGE